MKPKNQLSRMIATVLCLLAFVSASFAKTNPLSYPKGIAVDSKGNLWVANSGDNNILAFSPGYGLQTADTITEGISNPSGVAFDAQGNLWVANYGTSNGGANGSVSEYVKGKQNTSASITNGILGPEAIAVDGLGNVWVENDFSNVTVYAPSSVYSQPFSLLRTLAPSFPMYGITVSDGAFSWGSNIAVAQVAATPALASGTISGYTYGNDTGIALASDASGNVYMGNLDGSVNIASPLVYEYGFIKLSSPPLASRSTMYVGGFTSPTTTKTRFPCTALPVRC